MTTQLICNQCRGKEFLVNGWEVTEETLEREDVAGVYDEDDLEKVDIIEVMCADCENTYMTVTGGEV